MAQEQKITKVIDNLGRVLIPKDLRKQIGLQSDDELEMSVQNGKIVLEKKTKRCTICMSEENLLGIGRNRFICHKCKVEIEQIENE